jgi:hypothetical protein
MRCPEPVTQTAQGPPLAPTPKPTETPPATPARRCTATTKDGKPCGMTPRPQPGLCFGHDSERHEHVVAAGRKCAAESHRRRLIASERVVVEIEAVEDLRRPLSQTLHQLHVSESESLTANGVACVRQVTTNGRPHWREQLTPDDQKRSAVSVVANSVHCTGMREGGQAPAAATATDSPF